MSLSDKLTSQYGESREIISEIDKHALRDILDDMKFSTRVDDDGDLFIVLKADDNYPYDVLIFFYPENEFLGIQGFANWKPNWSDSKAYHVINNIGLKLKYPKAYINNNNYLILENWIRLTKGVTKANLSESIRSTIGMIWNVHVKINKGEYD